MRIRFVIAAVLVASAARADFREFKQLPVDPSLDAALRRSAEATLKSFPKLTAENLAMSILDVAKPDVLSRADYHGDAPFYPASVIKLFYMVEVYHQRKENDPDVPRALHEMIAVSDNDATAFLLDTISDTCSGPELEGRALRKFIEKRKVANRYFNPMGYEISAMAKPWSFGPFGRDVQLMGGPDRPNRNRATANSVASLMLWIVRKRAVSPQASGAMLALLSRPLNPVNKDENQVTEFIGESLPAGTKLWSKAGWTSEVRHDAAYIELPTGRKLILVIFTRGTA
ncbi:MAG TPA: serine hydrolase, partial [Thermoanaerobaculia bacterium]